MHSEDVADSADAQALTEEGKFCLRDLTRPYAFMHGPGDVCFCQELCETRGSTAIPRATFP